MNNRDFIANLVQKTGVDADQAANLLDSFVSSIAEQVREGKVVSIQGFGNFELKEKAERKIYSPSTKSFNIIPSKRVINYKMSPVLKDRINTL